tara:strand:+ start:447 stop:614 length:168 start_codon:yes stop_codon:yes gene_type:complete
MESVNIWVFIATMGISAVGAVLGMEIKRLRGQIDLILENQKDMAIQIAKLEAKLK